MPNEGIRIKGLRELTSALRHADTDLYNEMRRDHTKVANMIIAKAASAAESLGGVARKAAPAMSARAQANSIKIRLDGDRYPFALGAEFGAVEYRQFQAWRGSGSGAGYFLYPTIREEREETIATYLAGLDRVIAHITSR